MNLSVYKINRNDICPCGSRKKYKKCCMDKVYIINKNYKDEIVMIDREYSDTHYMKIIEMNESITPNSKISIEEALSKLEQLYNLYDEAVEPLQKYISCKKGCNTCCNLAVDMTEIEAELIKKFVIENFTKEKIDIIERNLSISRLYCPDTEVLNRTEGLKFKYFKLKRPCDFLDENGECSIYKVRPLACRKYFVLSSPEICEANETNKPLEYNGGINDCAENTVCRISAISCGNGIKADIRTLPHWFYI
jgi:uncharacterized protein